MKSSSLSLARTSAYFNFGILFGPAGFTSCVSSKSVVYFQGKGPHYSSCNITQTCQPSIQPNDQLFLVMGSSSPRYSLHKNDVIHVEPVKARLTSTDRPRQVLPRVPGSLKTVDVLPFNPVRI